MDLGSEKECNMLGTLFQNIISDWKTSSPAWEEFVSRGFKLHSLLKSTTIAMSAFIESIQKIADSATHSKGSTKDVGSALTRICVRQKMVENKLKQFTFTMMDNLLVPIQEKLEEWKKIASQLEKDHAKEYKKATNEIKKKNSDTLRLQKKARKGSKPDLHYQLNAAMHDVNERFNVLEEAERSALRNLLVEERSRVCTFANCLSPLLDIQASMMDDGNHLHELTSDMANLCRNPKQLPNSTDQLVNDFVSSGRINNDVRPALGLSKKEEDSSSNGSRKLSSFSSDNHHIALTRNSTVRLRHSQQSTSIQSHGRNGNGENTSDEVISRPLSFDSDRYSSVSSRDSGFVSTEVPDFPPSGSTFKTSNQAKIENARLTSSRTNGQHDHVTFPNPNKFSWKDWSIPGPYDLLPSDGDSSDVSKSLPPPLSPKPAYYTQYPVSDEVCPLDGAFTFPPPLPPSEPDVHYTRKCETPPDMDDPLPPPPSAYDTDVIVSDDRLKHRSERQKFSTLPRNYLSGDPEVAACHQRRPISTTEITRLSGSSNDLSRVATIRRKPSSKLTSGRFSSGPIAVRTPSVPSGGAVANLLSTFIPPSTVGNSFNGNAF